ncbi:hydroxyacid dehydrogenase [Brachybacterium sp. NPDC056505]|uniref:hydroxyacid dehydrogenase n=1 Tax=Brachybacterium sp. NPDC056505 TaxID=3345843 RepID=UPI00366B7DD6
MVRSRTPTGFMMPEPSFRRVFGQVDLRRLESDPAVDLLADSPLDPRSGADRRLLGRLELLITGWGTPRIDARTLELLPNLRAIAHSAGTVRPVVDPIVYDRGIAVSSAASANAVPVAEFTLALITLAAKRAFWAADRVRDGAVDADLETAWPAVGIRGRTVGIVGASTIGRLVIDRLRGLDLDVLLHDPTVRPAEAAELGAQLLDLPELVARSEILSLHAPSLPSTRGMIDRTLIGSLRPGATLINTARGDLLDQEALVERLERGDLVALLDVASEEPLPRDSRLRGAPNTFLTPHIAGSIGTELGRLSAHAVDEAIAFAASGAFRCAIDQTTFALRA